LLLNLDKDNIFCGDSIFHTDIGSARCDFPGGSATDLFVSGRRLLSLPDHVKIWTGHDYPPPDRREPVPYVTVGDHKKQNAHLRDGVSEEEFVKMRSARDEVLGAPRLLHQSLQMNIRAGRLPEATEVGQRLMHVPLKFAVKW
jgi:glyoxylase-like metal-dependent hydrolase (beta-lactamase superfamily II)